MPHFFQHARTREIHREPRELQIQEANLVKSPSNNKFLRIFRHFFAVDSTSMQLENVETKERKKVSKSQSYLPRNRNAF